MKLVAPECTQCGAKLRVGAGARAVTCTYCGTELTIEHEDPGVTDATRSDDTRAPVTITFVNERAAPLELVWLDFAGAAKSYGRLEPHEPKLFNTYVAHVWSLRDAASGEEILRWAARDQVPRRVAVR
jgi:hypothetical protein